MPGKTKVLFIRPGISPFIQKDLNLLEEQEHLNVKVIDAALSRRNVKGTLITLLNFVEGILWADVSFSWFADFNAFLAVLLATICRKKSIVVTGGYDVANEPNISYGIMRLPKSRSARMARFVLRHGDMILPFSDYAAEQVLGINQNANLKALPLACDSEKFAPGGQKENLVLTVCVVVQSNISRKGLRTFVESARYVPEAKFVLVGAHVDDAINYLKAIAPPNVEFTGYVSEGELIRWYQRAKVYCQLSYQEGEGAGGALGEAMACECIPVVSEKAIALRETVGDCGFCVPYGDIDATVGAVKKALDSLPEAGRESRGRMISLFSMRQRGEELSRVIDEVVKCHK
jgi:glycosyltransferase involved in cell wall biosynthesis